MASVYDAFMRPAERASLGGWRRELLRDLKGAVLEVGAGTGANLPFYPASVARLVLAEPDAHMRAKLERRVARMDRPEIEVADASLERLPWANASFDAVVATLVFCSVEEPAQAFAEVHRVLVPGGAYVFLEHVAAEHDARRFAWQRRIEPLWRPIAGGCHLTRRTADAIRAAGFEVDHEVRESARRTLPIVRTMVRGVARKAVT